MKFRKSMNVSFVLLPIMMFTISIPMFYFSYVTRDINNTKKVLQEAAYTGALAGSLALDIYSFEHKEQAGRGNVTYPIDIETGNDAAFMKQTTKRVREGSLINENDCLKGNQPGTQYPTGNSNDVAAGEVVKAVEEYLKNNLNMQSDGTNKPVYTTADYSIAMEFSRDGLSPNNNPTMAPYNKVTVSVSLNYKPIMAKHIFGEIIPIYGTSSAKTKTIS